MEKGIPVFHPLELPARQRQRAESYMELRDTYHRLYNDEAEHRQENGELRAGLNGLYDGFVRQFGNLNDKKNIDLFRMDADNREISPWSVTPTARRSRPTSLTIPCRTT